MAIQHPLNGERLLFDTPRGSPTRSARRGGDGIRERVPPLAWMRGSVGPSGVSRAEAKPRRERERRTVFQNWAADDLAYRDVAPQLWPAARAQ